MLSASYCLRHSLCAMIRSCLIEFDRLPHDLSFQRIMLLSTRPNQSFHMLTLVAVARRGPVKCWQLRCNNVGEYLRDWLLFQLLARSTSAPKKSFHAGKVHERSRSRNDCIVPSSCVRHLSKWLMANGPKVWIKISVILNTAASFSVEIYPAVPYPLPIGAPLRPFDFEIHVSFLWGTQKAQVLPHFPAHYQAWDVWSTKAGELPHLLLNCQWWAAALCFRGARPGRLCSSCHWEKLWWLKIIPEVGRIVGIMLDVPS